MQLYIGVIYLHMHRINMMIRLNAYRRLWVYGERERGEKEKDQPGESQRQELQLRVTEVFEINLV